MVVLEELVVMVLMIQHMAVLEEEEEEVFILWVELEVDIKVDLALMDIKIIKVQQPPIVIIMEVIKQMWMVPMKHQVIH